MSDQSGGRSPFTVTPQPMQATSQFNASELAGVITVLQQIVVNQSALIAAINSKFPNWVAVPATAVDTGVAGQVAYESGWFYVCVASNTWERVAIATF